VIITSHIVIMESLELGPNAILILTQGNGDSCENTMRMETA